jgi:hypothetical protein
MPRYRIEFRSYNIGADGLPVPGLGMGAAPFHRRGRSRSGHEGTASLCGTACRFGRQERQEDPLRRDRSRLCNTSVEFAAEKMRAMSVRTRPRRIGTSFAMLLACVALAPVGCITKPAKYELDPDHPLDMAIVQRHQSDDEVTKYAKRAIERLAGPGAGLAEFERALLAVGASCERGAVLRCGYRKQTRFPPFREAQYYQLDIDVARDRFGARRFTACFGRTIVQSQKPDWSDLPEHIVPTRMHCGPAPDRER